VSILHKQIASKLTLPSTLSAPAMLPFALDVERQVVQDGQASILDKIIDGVQVPIGIKIKTGLMLATAATQAIRLQQCCQFGHTDTLLTPYRP
jgi:hypothetical protein